MDVVVLGDCCMDFTSYVSRQPSMGETIAGHKFLQGFGGKGGNQCIVSSRLGAKTAIITRVGDDTFGPSCIQNFKDNNVNTDYVSITKETSTGIASITVDDSGQNAISFVIGANKLPLLSEQDLQAAEKMIASAKVFLCQLCIPNFVTLAALKMAKKHSVTTILNAAPGKRNLDPEIYKYCDIICPNESEAGIITGQAMNSVEGRNKAIAVLVERGCKTIIITLGENGAVYVTKDNPTPVHVQADKVKPVDTTGAGDCFAGALAFYVSHYPQMELGEAIRRSSQIATISVQSAGTQTSYSWKKDLPAHLFS